MSIGDPKIINPVVTKVNKIMNSIKANAYTNRHDNQLHLLYFHWTNNIMNNIPSADKKNCQQLKTLFFLMNLSDWVEWELIDRFLNNHRSTQNTSKLTQIIVFVHTRSTFVHELCTINSICLAQSKHFSFISWFPWSFILKMS